MPVNSYRPEVQAMLPRWEAIRDTADGPTAVKAKCSASRKYLPHLPGQKIVTLSDGRRIDMYGDYLYRAVLLPFVSALLSRVVGLLLRKAPVVKVPASMESHLSNISLTAPAMTEEQFAKCVARENIQTGHGAIYVDWDVAQRRPYQRLFAAGTILDWRMSLIPGSAISVPSHVRVMEPAFEPNPKDEYVQECVEQVKTFTIEGAPALSGTQMDAAAAAGANRYPLGMLVIRTYRQRRDDNGQIVKDDWVQVGGDVIPDRRGAPLWFIPIVPFNPFRLSWDLEKPPIETLVELVLADFLISADYYELLHKVGAGTILFGKGFAREVDSHGNMKPIQVGPGAAHIDSSADADLKYVQASGESAGQLLEARADLRAAMAIAIGKLLMFQQKNVEESGTALELQFGGEDANLQQIGGTVAMALEEAMKIHAWWMGTAETPADVEDVSVDLADSFISRRLAANELLSLVNAIDMSGLFTLRDKFHLLKQAEALAPMTTFEEWSAELAKGATDAGGVDLGEVRQSLDLLKRAFAAKDAAKMQAAMQSLVVLVGEGEQLPAADEAMGGAA